MNERHRYLIGLFFFVTAMALAPVVPLAIVGWGVKKKLTYEWEGKFLPVDECTQDEGEKYNRFCSENPVFLADRWIHTQILRLKPSAREK